VKASGLGGLNVNENLRRFVAADAQAAPFDIQKASRTGLKHLEFATFPQAHLGQAAYPRRFPGDLGDATPFTGLE